MIGDQILMYSRDRDSDLLRFANSLKEMGGD